MQPNRLAPADAGSQCQSLHQTLACSEGLNGIVEDGSYEACADSTKRRVRGVAAQSILVAFGRFAANLRKIDTFMDLAVVEPDGALRKPKKRRRKEKPIQDFALAAASSDPPNTA